MSKLDELLSTQMTRKQFLLTLFAGIIGLFGLSAILGLFSHNAPMKDEQHGYGLMNYGP